MASCLTFNFGQYPPEEPEEKECFSMLKDELFTLVSVRDAIRNGTVNELSLPGGKYGNAFRRILSMLLADADCCGVYKKLFPERDILIYSPEINTSCFLVFLMLKGKSEESVYGAAEEYLSILSEREASGISFPDEMPELWSFAVESAARLGYYKTALLIVQSRPWVYEKLLSEMFIENETDIISRLTGKGELLKVKKYDSYKGWYGDTESSFFGHTVRERHNMPDHLRYGLIIPLLVKSVTPRGLHNALDGESKLKKLPSPARLLETIGGLTGKSGAKETLLYCLGSDPAAAADELYYLLSKQTYTEYFGMPRSDSEKASREGKETAGMTARLRELSELLASAGVRSAFAGDHVTDMLTRLRDRSSEARTEFRKEHIKAMLPVLPDRLVTAQCELPRNDLEFFTEAYKGELIFSLDLPPVSGRSVYDYQADYISDISGYFRIECNIPESGINKESLIGQFLLHDFSSVIAMLAKTGVLSGKTLDKAIEFCVENKKLNTLDRINRITAELQAGEENPPYTE